MCVILAKYFDDYGWVAVKNRDRNYTPEIEFRRKHTLSGTEILLFDDKITGYSEGINSAGVGILSASLMVINDEKEVSKSNREQSSPDGARIFGNLAVGGSTNGVPVFSDGSNWYIG